MYDNKLYTLKTLTNLHVGGGDSNYSIIDKQVQRDVLTGLPTIHSSSFKGAMKEYIKYSNVSKQDLRKDGEVNEETTRAGDKIIYTIFGTEPNENKKKAGHVIFSEVKLLSIPVRTSKIPYMNATCPSLIKEYNNICKMYDIDESIKEFSDNDNYYYADGLSGNIIFEEMDYAIGSSESVKELEVSLGKNVVLLTDKQFRKIMKQLPFLARNYLDNGESKNLFYEEVVPRESLFYTVIQYPNKNLLNLDKKDSKAVKHLEDFKDTLKDLKFYLGANTSIGYGYCQLTDKAVTMSTKG